jgi:non-ribosomal peptide synthetase component F
MASLSFDVCTADMVRALGFGGRLVLCPRELLADEAGLYALIRRRGVDFADFVPTVLVPLMAHVESVGGTLAGFETLICGSEAWTPANARRLRTLCGPAARIVNAYGVTEAAVDSTHFVLPACRSAGRCRACGSTCSMTPVSRCRTAPPARSTSAAREWRAATSTAPS